MIPKDIYEDEGIEKYLCERQLLKQYIKAVKSIKESVVSGAYFSERQPKGSNIRYFRINKKYRAWGSFDTEGNLRVFKIDDHQ